MRFLVPTLPTLYTIFYMMPCSLIKNWSIFVILMPFRLIKTIYNGFHLLTVFIFEGCDIVMTPLCPAGMRYLVRTVSANKIDL